MLAVLAITLGTTLLTKDAELRWAPWPVLQLVTAAILTVLSGVCINILPTVVLAVWRLTEKNTEQALELLRKLKQALRRPARWTGIAVTVLALVAAGVALRPRPTGLEPGDLVIMSAFASDPRDSRTMLLDQWNRLNPRNHARFELAAVNSDEQHASMVNDAKPGGKHRADIYTLDIVWMAEFISRGYIQALNESALSEKDLGDFVPKIRQTCEDENGNLWALPLNSDVGLIYRRTGIPGVDDPKSWDDYFGAAAKNKVIAARAGHPEIQAANAAQLLVGDEMLTITALEAIWAAGGMVVGLNGQPVLNSNRSKVVFGPNDLNGLNKLAAAAHDPDIVLPEAGESTAEVATKAFADGRTAYMRNWPVARGNIGDHVSFDAVAPPRGNPSVLGGQNLAIAADTDKPRAAQALIQFLTSGSSEQILSEVGGFVPTRQSAFTYSTRPDAEQIQLALNDARLRPVTPCYVRFSQLFREGVSRALNNNGVPEDNFATQLATVLRCT